MILNMMFAFGIPLLYMGLSMFLKHHTPSRFNPKSWGVKLCIFPIVLVSAFILAVLQPAAAYNICTVWTFIVWITLIIILIILANHNRKGADNAMESELQFHIFILSISALIHGIGGFATNYPFFGSQAATVVPDPTVGQAFLLWLLFTICFTAVGSIIVIGLRLIRKFLNKPAIIVDGLVLMVAGAYAFVGVFTVAIQLNHMVAGFACLGLFGSVAGKYLEIEPSGYIENSNGERSYGQFADQNTFHSNDGFTYTKNNNGEWVK